MKQWLWPDAAQTLLLRSAIGEPAEAIVAFDLWVASVDYETTLDGGSFRLLPMAYAHQRRLGNDNPALRKLAAVYRSSWCEVQCQLRAAELVAGVLLDAGVPVLASKGIVLGTTYYASAAERPMTDIDIVVPMPCIDVAVEALGRAGWNLARDYAVAWEARRNYLVARSNGLSLFDSSGTEIDLQWRVIGQARDRRLEQLLWDRAVPHRMGRLDVHRLDPTALLFHAIVHGLAPNRLPPIRWIADAVMIVRRDAEEIDWSRLVSLARSARLEHRLRLGLDYLGRTFALPLPPEAAAAIGTGTPRGVEAIEQAGFRAAMAGAPGSRSKRLEMLALAARVGLERPVAGLAPLWFDWVKRRFSARRHA